MAAQGPWGNAFGPLSLALPLHALPEGSRKNFPKFFGDGQHPDEHVAAFYIACGVHGVEYEDVSVRLFVETLQGVAADWFYHLAPSTITNWATLIAKFEERFKPPEDAHALLAQLTQLKKESHMPMREFIAHFNKLTRRIPTVAQPTAENLKCFFVNAQVPEVGFLLRRSPAATLAMVQTLATKIEDDLILAGQIKIESNKSEETPSLELFSSFLRGRVSTLEDTSAQGTCSFERTGSISKEHAS